MADVFEGKSLQDLLQDIHNTTLDKRSEIKDFIYEIRKCIQSKDDMVMLAPIIKDYFDLLIKNDDSLTKIATIVQRIISADGGKGGGGLEDLLSDDEKEALIAGGKKEIEAELAKLDATRAQLRHRSALLDPRKADPDMADELVRRDLGLVRADEVILPL